MYTKHGEKIRLRGDDRLHIIPLGDLHVGHESFNKDYYEFALDYIHMIDEPIIIYLMGDLVEVADKKVGDSVFHSNLSVNEQVWYVIESLEEYKDNIGFICIGNHEHRLKETYNLNISGVMEESLKAESGYSVVEKVMINKEPLYVFMFHGSGWSKYEHTAISKLYRDTMNIEADIFLQGHNHRLGHYSQPYIDHKGSGKVKRKHYFFTGTFLGHANYAKAKNLPYLPEAFVDITVDKKGVVRSDMKYIDIEAEDLMLF